MTTAQLIALLSSPLAPVVIGLVGSALEKLGLAYEWPRVIAFGKMLEAAAADLPKLIANTKALAAGTPKGPPSSGGATVEPPAPQPSVMPPNGFDAEIRAWPGLAALGVALVSLLILSLGCGATPPAKAPCDERSLAIMTRECTARAFECGMRGVPKSECTAIQVCDSQLEARKKECTR